MKVKAFSLQMPIASLLAAIAAWLKSGFSGRHWQQEMVLVPVRNQQERVLASRQYRRK